ncbi:uncharacterized protein KY384_007194 [Bacidia gigantensis]|uniref:uncharacterized protein n=1 Tax=Bacidia gigantensis TaxID=2732470 RepID=UPI001D036CB6|nr:uncharacterized protein KY384_007194 [Bacidia gigantensis]KAG8528277.1 hypothetical protein KY384_007194 [Bacidia gigantensis]
MAQSSANAMPGFTAEQAQSLKSMMTDAVREGVTELEKRLIPVIDRAHPSDHGQGVEGVIKSTARPNMPGLHVTSDRIEEIRALPSLENHDVDFQELITTLVHLAGEEVFEYFFSEDDAQITLQGSSPTDYFAIGRKNLDITVDFRQSMNPSTPFRFQMMKMSYQQAAFSVSQWQPQSFQRFREDLYGRKGAAQDLSGELAYLVGEAFQQQMLPAFAKLYWPDIRDGIYKVGRISKRQYRFAISPSMTTPGLGPYQGKESNSLKRYSELPDLCQKIASNYIQDQGWVNPEIYSST